MRVIISLIILLQVSSFSYCQQSTFNSINPDSMFIVAKNHAQNNELMECRDICFNILKQFPDYYDFTILAGRTMAWEQNFDSAKVIIKPVLNREPYHKEALLALADIEIWQQQFYNALAYVDTGLVAVPDDEQLLEKREEILDKLAAQSMQKNTSYGTLYPDSNSVGILYYFEFYKKPYIARRHMISAHYTRITDFAPITGRFNIGDNVLNNEKLFQNPSYQLEVDAYPSLGNDSYLYLNYGIASGTFFPKHRIGVEYFKGLSNSFEFSIGSRFMYWDSSILFLTGSISKYWGAYWFSFRPFFSIGNGNFSDSYLFETRRYFGIHSSYIYGLIIYGDSPDQPLSLVDEFGNFKSIKYVFGINHRITDLLLNAGIGIQREEYFKNKLRTRVEYRLGVSYVF
jgi:YaiO family outer membrane protein